MCGIAYFVSTHFNFRFQFFDQGVSGIDFKCFLLSGIKSGKKHEIKNAAI